MVSSILLQQSINCLIYNNQLGKNLKNGLTISKPNLMQKCTSSKRIGGIKARASFDTIETTLSSTGFPLFQTESPQEDTLASKFELVDPEFIKMGFLRDVRTYGVEFREGPNGMGVYASRDIEPTRRAKKDWDLRMTCLLLYAFECEKNFWQLYYDFLPSAEECTSLLLATEHSAMPLKVKRLAREPERFMWALSMAQSRQIGFKIRVGSLVQHANMLAPYADMLSHSSQPNCFFHWRFKDRMFVVMTIAGRRVKKGEEMTVNYTNGMRNNMLMQRYGFSTPANPWDVIPFSGNAKIHLDSFLSAFNICGSPKEYYHNAKLANEGDNFVDGAVIAAARTLPMWSEGDLPPVPSLEIKSAKALQEECQEMLAEYSTTSEQDQHILDSSPEMSWTREAAIKYRLHRKLFLEKVIQALDVYQDRILF
ncbi:Rubisco LS methyltransferase, substrate-binding domain-containing protein [Cynara cardunculus var. scolymus]|uniref:Rubisco LS methyltransferase, substrate-binding domain-containing protein n=1 Tax=Cynara cardunculus var. scolymus TaxID=59895 RepID=A0A124SB36_CYNCS|nr:Rubisco LS methyltransferase, substrate-binding domain-containing protein [Cynara cardunculus var. scolymus]